MTTTTTKDWDIISETSGSDRSENSAVTSLESDSPTCGNASCSPPHKRPRLPLPLDDSTTRPQQLSHTPPLSPTSDPVAEKARLEEALAFLMSCVDNMKFVKPREMGPSDIKEYAQLALAQYKQHTGLDYDFTRVRTWCPFIFPNQSYKGTHFNFYASLKGSQSNAQEQLFYAEIDHRDKKVYNCCVLPSGLDGGYEVYMLHPEHVTCEGCVGGYETIGAWEVDIC